MKGKIYRTTLGEIRYWTGGKAAADGPALVFLPGLTADHRLFDKQIDYFEPRCPVVVWDPPGHASSWPFALTFSLMDQARWVEGILCREGFGKPVIVGQSMGGYVGQAYAELYPEKLRGFVAIDSAPLQREYVTGAELWLLKRMEPLYRLYPWGWLLRSGVRGVAVTEYGRGLMAEMMAVYSGDKERYARLAGHGFRMLAEAMEADRAYQLCCPALLLCGERDRAGSCKRYNRAWHKRTGIPVRWLKNAGHNANTDVPELVNRLIETFLRNIDS